MKERFGHWIKVSILATVLAIGLTITSRGAEDNKIISDQLRSQVKAIKVEKEVILNQPEIYRTKGTTFVAAAQIFKVLGRQIEWRQDTKQLMVDNGKFFFL